MRLELELSDQWLAVTVDVLMGLRTVMARLGG